ncbi:MAG TPA: ATP-binding protein [Gemmatimonadales bacterium]|nr:ATP-binding protein [Gemmatimonadales bacterium]
MPPFRDRPIRQKVIILIFVASLVGLLFAATFVSIYDAVSFRRRAVNDARALAGVVSANAISAIVFDDTATAREDLATLADRREIGSAAIYLPGGREFARYTRPGGPAAVAEPPGREETAFLSDRLISVTRLESNGEHRGWLRIQYMVPGFESRIPQYAMVAAAVLAALGAAAALLLGTLGRSVSRPLHQLADTARALAATNDLRIRATRHADDEIGSVTAAFNRMLDALEEREAALADRARALRESEERLRLALGAATMQTWVMPLASDGERVTAEPGAMAQFLGGIHADDRASLEAAIEKAATSGGGLEAEFRTAATGGPERRIALRGHVSAEHGGRAAQLIGVAQDVTGRRQLEEQLLQAQKMEAIGNLAGGIAHDFNNLLTGMIGHLKFVQRAVEPGTQVRADVDEIERAARRAAALTSQLLSYARRQMVTPTVVDVNAAVVAIEPMLQRALGETITVEAQLDERVAPVRVDGGQLEQVLVNLAVNARDAMRGGGRLTITTASREVSDAAAGDGKAGPYSEIAVADTGEGIAPEVLPHIFEPFYTTKPVGQGTGLGLAMCYGIVRQADGHIRVESEPGKGTTVRIRLPALPEVSGAPVTPPPLPADTAGGHESVLLAEDNPAIRELAARTLREAGYQVTEAEDGARARELADVPGAAFDLLVTDVVMPGQTGRELAAALRKSRPSLPVVFMSGYSDVAGDGHDPADPFLPKPFAPDDLRRAARQALDARRGATA